MATIRYIHHAMKPSDIAAHVIAELNAGRRETANLAEGLSVDFVQLLSAVAPELDPKVLAFQAKDGITRKFAKSADALFATYGADAFDRFQGHPSDTMRGLAAFVLARVPDLSLAERLDRIRPLADDDHFGVREWAWLAIRDLVAAELEGAIELLNPWVRDESYKIRRYASELTRPRGVWCAHSELLKERPEFGLPLLEPLKSDPSRYVQDSVANWLNDASKTQAQWVIDTCATWRAESDTKATERICTRAQRTVKKAQTRP